MEIDEQRTVWALRALEHARPTSTTPADAQKQVVEPGSGGQEVHA